MLVHICALRNTSEVRQRRPSMLMKISRVQLGESVVVT